MRLLVVDDDADVLQRVIRTLTQVDGFEAIGCTSGVEALARARAEPPDAILLDLMMPTMSGPAFLERLQRDGSGREIPVILLTAADPEAVASIVGARGVIRKPFDVIGLGAEVRRILDMPPLPAS